MTRNLNVMFKTLKVQLSGTVLDKAKYNII